MGRTTRKEAARYYTVQEVRAWHNRPYGCHSLRAALEHEQRRSFEESLEYKELLNVKERTKRRHDFEAVPEWCYAREHPLKTGRRGRLYQKWDVVAPLVDAMSLLYETKTDDPLSLFVECNPKKRQKLSGDDSSRAADAADAADGPSTQPSERARGARPGAWTCPCCGNADTKSQLQHKDALLCPCGFVVRMGGERIATHREKLGAEENEDKTQHADRPREPRVHWSERDDVPSAAERRNERKHAAQGSKIGGRIKGLGRLCDAQRIAEDAAAKEARASEVSAGLKLTPKDETKGWTIIEKINQLARMLAPVEHEVKRKLRQDADRLWHLAVSHSHSCTRSDCCEIRLTERTPAIIAAASFETSIEQMLHEDGEDGDDGPRVTRQHLLDVQARLRRCPTFTNPSSLAQINTAKAMIEILTAPDFDASAACAPTLSNSATNPVFHEVAGSSAQSSQLKTHTPFSRVSSASFDGESPPPTDAVQMRDAISTVFLAHRSELPVMVREGAQRAIQAQGFLDACREGELKSATPQSPQSPSSPQSLQALAFCLLNAVRREQAARASGPSFGATKNEDAFNVAIAMKLKLDLAVAERAIESIRPILPAEAVSAPGREDDLFS